MMEGLKIVSQKKKYTGIYRGLVEDNNDPKKYGRVRVRVYPYFADIDKELLPWAVPAYPIFDGAGLDGEAFGWFAIPKVGSFVFVFFEMGDIYQPVYFAEAPTAKYGINEEGMTNYPNRKVLRTRGGIEIIIDDQTNLVKLSHPSGTEFSIGGDGHVDVNAVGDVIIKGSTVQINP